VPPEFASHPVSARSGIDAFIVMEVLAAANRRAAAGGDVLHLEIGQPGGGPPASAVAAAQRAIEGPDAHRYTEALGLPDLRTRIAEHYRAWYGVEVAPERVAVTAGASGAFVLAFLAAFDAGQRVALAEPGYPAYRNILKALDIEVVPLPTTLGDGFQPTVALLEEMGGPLDGLIVASPANPTGSMLDGRELAMLTGYCRAHGIRVIADEIYHGLTYSGPAATILEHTDDAFVVNSFSKFFGMTGWRVGWMVVPEPFLEPVSRLGQNLFIAPSAIGQYAALGAFDGEDELLGRLERYRHNRSVLLEALPRMGIERVAPADGAFYLYADVGHLTDDSVGLCRRLLEETGVALTPGVDFDTRLGHRYLRLSFAGGKAVVEEAAERLLDWFRTRA